MKPDTANRVRATGFRVIQSLDLQPGRYLLRVAVREGNTRKAGIGDATTSRCRSSRRRH